MTTSIIPGIAAGPRSRRRIRVRGIVQGVGFRPFVYGAADALHLDGFVGNDTEGVFVEAEGAPAALDELLRRLHVDPPPLARVDTVESEAMPTVGETGFRIVASDAEPSGITFVAPDAAVCADCLGEMFDPYDRRFRYPFVNCTNCGPRFTITTALPYDRPNTTMAGFAMCSACRQEYEDPADRRHHAEPVACPRCGPQIAFLDARGVVAGTDPALSAALRALHHGRILAVKGIGGYHLVCDATDDAAIGELRARKHRPGKAFAVMARDLDVARRLAAFDESGVAELTSWARPIVLARRRRDAPLSALVAPANPRVGVMLPYAPLHHLLFSAVPGDAVAPPVVLVMTSGNLTDEPICHDDADARRRLEHVADAWIVHDRPIHVPCDDSVVQVVDHVVQPVRRSRGHSPSPITLPFTTPPLLALGGDLKNAFCLATGPTAWMSQHLGDVGSVESLTALERSIDQFCRLYRVEPQAMVVDLHPGYVTRRLAEASSAEVIGVQHHHAHAAALMAEHGVGRDDAVVVCALDGTGYGTDGTVWGGEVLVTHYDDIERRGGLRTVRVPGGDASIRSPARVALAHLRAAGVPWSDDLHPVQALSPEARGVLDRQLTRGALCATTSSAGRLFDALSSLLGVCHTSTYEGQAAMALEAVATDAADDGPPLECSVDDDGVIDPATLLHAVVELQHAGCPVPSLARAFHVALADALAEVVVRTRDDTGISCVGLTGGVFQNALLTTLLRRRFEADDVEVLVHRRVPPNDGGLALGQIAVAAARHGASP